MFVVYVSTTLRGGKGGKIKKNIFFALRISNFFFSLSRTYVPSCKECYVLYAGDHFCLQNVCAASIH